jgi:hypothetical protein
MVASEKTVVDALSALTEKLASLEKKVDSYGGDLGKVQESGFGDAVDLIGPTEAGSSGEDSQISGRGYCNTAYLPFTVRSHRIK